MNRLSSLGHLKFSHMIGHFESHALLHISPYFYPLRQHLTAFWNTLFPQRTAAPILGRRAVESTTTCKDIIQVLEKALLDPALINQAKKVSRDDSILGKRSRAGELSMDASGWDPVKRKPGTVKPTAKMSSKVRQTKFMGKTQGSKPTRK
jgi:hypothetical protein